MINFARKLKTEDEDEDEGEYEEEAKEKRAKRKMIVFACQTSIIQQRMSKENREIELGQMRQTTESTREIFLSRYV